MEGPHWIERWRRLPYSGRVLVRPGDSVQAEQTVACLDYIPGAMRRVDVAHGLRVAGSQLREHLLPEIGEAVQTGQLLAANTAFGQRLGVLAPLDGYVGPISRSLGYVYLRQPIPVGQRTEVVLDVRAELNLPAARVSDSLRVQTGMAIVAGQVIAERRIRWNRQFLLSPVYGKVVEIDAGKVTIQPLFVRTELTAYLSGRVSAVVEQQAVAIQARAEVVNARYGVGGEAGGQLLIAAAADDVLSQRDVHADWRGKVVVGGRTADLDTLRSAAERGAKALVLAHLPLADLQQWSGSDLVGFTGDEQTPFTLLLTEGFLPAAMAQSTWRRLSRLQGRFASVNGTTQIRAGVIRPELVVCIDDCREPALDSRRLPAAQRLTVGQRVRALAGQHRGAVGEVIDLPAERQLIASGAAVKVAMVRLPSGAVAIPVGNLELWSDPEWEPGAKHEPGGVQDGSGD